MIVRIKQSLIATLAAAFAIAHSVSGCGSGSGSGVGVGGTGTASTSTVATTPVTSSGAIAGFGSVIVNGVKYDESSASVVRDGGTANGSSLRLGMTIEVSGSLSADGLTGIARQIRVFSELKGAVQSVQSTQASAGLLTVLGVPVHTDASTVFDGVANLAAVRVGDIVEAYGFRNAVSGDVTATRVEVQASGNPTAPVPVSLSGTVQNLNVTNRSFTLGGQTVQYAGATVTGTLVGGAHVQVTGTATTGVNPLVTATSVSVKTYSAPGEGMTLKVEGLVSDFVSRASFRLNGTPVDAGSTSLRASQVALLANGARCEASGKIGQGVLRATELECDSGASASGRSYQIYGTVSGFVSVANFTVRNQTIDASAANFESGRATDLMLDAKVEVKGPVVGGVLKATSVKID